MLCASAVDRACCRCNAPKLLSTHALTICHRCLQVHHTASTTALLMTLASPRQPCTVWLQPFQDAAHWDPYATFTDTTGPSTVLAKANLGQVLLNPKQTLKQLLTHTLPSQTATLPTNHHLYTPVPVNTGCSCVHHRSPPHPRSPSGGGRLLIGGLPRRLPPAGGCCLCFSLCSRVYS